MWATVGLVRRFITGISEGVMAERHSVTVAGGFEIREAISTGDGDLEPGEILYGVGYGAANVENGNVQEAING